jgi:hypothetical protein
VIHATAHPTHLPMVATAMVTMMPTPNQPVFVVFRRLASPRS